MILLLASIADRNAAAFAREFEGSAAVFTCQDLARWPGHLLHPCFEQSAITVGGRLIRVSEISAVLNLLPAVFPDELSFYAEEERAYQSAELHALLAYFLTSLSCPVVNRPSTVSLTGPVLNPASWLTVAHAAGIPVACLDIASTERPMLPEHDPSLQVVCVGGSVVTATGTVVDTYTMDLARHCGLLYVLAQFRREESEIRFTGASSYPDIRCERTRQALRRYLMDGAA